MLAALIKKELLALVRDVQAYALDSGVQRIIADVLRENTGMRTLINADGRYEVCGEVDSAPKALEAMGRMS